MIGLAEQRPPTETVTGFWLLVRCQQTFYKHNKKSLQNNLTNVLIGSAYSSAEETSSALSLKTTTTAMNYFSLSDFPSYVY